MDEELERDWETVDRLVNWSRVYGRRGHASPWGLPPWISMERRMRLEFGHEVDDEEKETKASVPVASRSASRPIDIADADIVNRALIHPLLPKEHKRLLVTFYCASEAEWRSYGRLCRKAGTTRRKGEIDLAKAEWRLGVLLRTCRCIKHHI